MIQAGYMLQVTSWENDGDNYNTITLTGLTKEKVKFYLELLQYFNGAKDQDFGNMYYSSDEEYQEAVDTITEFVKSYIGLVLTPDEFEHITQEPANYMSQLLGNGENYTFRRFDSAKVYFIPMELLEVSDNI